MLGLDWQLSSSNLALGRLRHGLDTAGVALPDLLEALDGPLRDLVAERAAADALKAEIADRARQVLLSAGLPFDVANRPVTDRWLGGPGRSVVQAERAPAVLRRLPAAEGTLLAELASQTLGDPRALDRRFALGGAILRLFEYGRSGADRGRIQDAHTRLWAWSQAGVTFDRVSSLALVLNLPLPLRQASPGAGRDGRPALRRRRGTAVAHAPHGALGPRHPA